MMHDTGDSIDRQDAEPTMARRDLITTLGAGAAMLGLGGAAVGQTRPDGPGTPKMTPANVGWDPESGRYILPPLRYPYGALEPHIDEQTMRLHHDKHHAGYVRGLNAALDALAEIRRGERGADEVKRWSRQLAFHGSGHLLHVIFWNCMSPNGGGRPRGPIAAAIDEHFGSFDAFATHFKAAAASVEGSGWALLVLEPTSLQLMVMQAEKHQNLTAWGVIPVIAIDVWEHAYYLKYQNRRKAYVDAFMNVINWDFANRMVTGAMGALTR